jgi:hypothetical protein
MVFRKLLSLNEQSLAALFTDEHDRDDLVGTINIKRTRYLPKRRSSRCATGFGRSVL